MQPCVIRWAATPERRCAECHTPILPWCTALLQVQYSLLDRRPENGMAAFCSEHNIKLLPYGAVAGGFLSEKYLGAKPSE